MTSAISAKDRHTHYWQWTVLLLIFLSLPSCLSFPPTSFKTLTTSTNSRTSVTWAKTAPWAHASSTYMMVRAGGVPPRKGRLHPQIIHSRHSQNILWRVRGGASSAVVSDVGAEGGAVSVAESTSASSALPLMSSMSSTVLRATSYVADAENSGNAVHAANVGITANVVENVGKAASAENGEAEEEPESWTRQRYWRIATEMARQVWPPLPKLPPKPSTRLTHSGESGGGSVNGANGVNGVSNVTKVNGSSKAKPLDEIIYEHTKKEIQKERHHALSMRRRVVFSLVLMLAGKGVTIATPFLFKVLVDLLPHYVNVASSGGGVASVSSTAVASSLPVQSLLPLLSNLPISIPVIFLLAYGLSRTLSSLLKESTNAIFAHVAQSAIRSFGRSTFDHVHSLDLSYHLSKNTGTLSKILERGSRSISFVLNAMVFNTLPTLIEVGVVSWCMLQKFGIVHSFTVLFTILTYSMFTIAITRWRSHLRKEMNTVENIASGKVTDSLLNYETVKYFNNELHEGQTYENSLHQYQNMALKTQRSMAFLNFGQNAIFSAGLTFIMYLTMRDMMRGKATVGDLVLVNGLLFQLSVPLNFIGWVYQEVRQAFIDMEAMFNLRDTKPAVVDPPNAIEYDPVRDGTTIEFDNLEFSYATSAPTATITTTPTPSPTTLSKASAVSNSTETTPLHEEQIPTTRPILRKTTFTIPQGKTIAIVGSSGCGKSTLLRMIYRFYNPDAGSIRIGHKNKNGREGSGEDMKDISTYTTSSIRKSIAVVPQDVVLFNDSIGYNIHYGNLNAPWAEVIKAAKKAHLHEIISKLPNGYDTIVGERGLKMSGGEKQRVSLARAILKNAPILLCDEPTSSLDAETELEIMNNLKEVGRDGGRTCVIIAHRLSTVRDCDEIVVMDEGRVVERGTHEELVKKGGKYSKLLSFQRSHTMFDNQEDEEQEDVNFREQIELGFE